VPWPSKSPRAFPHAKLCTTVRRSPQKMAAQWGMGKTHELTRHCSEAGHFSRGPSGDLDLRRVNRSTWPSATRLSHQSLVSRCSEFRSKTGRPVALSLSRFSMAQVQSARQSLGGSRWQATGDLGYKCSKQCLEHQEQRRGVEVTSSSNQLNVVQHLPCPTARVRACC
jgi:hypothetical protein